MIEIGGTIGNWGLDIMAIDRKASCRQVEKKKKFAGKKSKSYICDER
jgi:hypothetical protein